MPTCINYFSTKESKQLRLLILNTLHGDLFVLVTYHGVPTRVFERETLMSSAT